MTREEAIQIIRETYHTDEEMKALESLIPELRESEDERIRKTIVATIEQCPDDFLNPKNRDRMLAYLERKKEQPISAEEVLARAGLKPYKDGNQWCILAGDNIQEGICGFGDTIDEALYQFLMEVLEKQKERGPLTKEEEYILHRIIEYLEDETCPPEWISLLHDIYCLPYEKQKEQKPAEWSEEDEKKIHFLSRLIEFQVKDGEYCFGEGACAISKQEAIEMLQSLRPQPKQEWSEEDERVYDILLNKFKQLYDCLSTSLSRKDIIDVYNFVKSLRPQPSWKPSEEQMKALAWYSGYYEIAPTGDKAIKSLYNDLKKL